jgi:transposase
MPIPRPRVFSREFKEAAVQRIAAGERVRAVATELKVWPKLVYDWWQLYERGGPEALRAPGRPRGSAPGERPRVVRDRPRGRRASQGKGVEAGGEPEVSRVAELERKIGQQALELDFFAQALRHIKASAPPSDGRGARTSSP